MWVEPNSRWYKMKRAAPRSRTKGLTLGLEVQETLDPFMRHAIVYLDGSKRTAGLKNPLNMGRHAVTCSGHSVASSVGAVN